jgi:DNA-binding GntR family transcriptional regulator
MARPPATRSPQSSRGTTGTPPSPLGEIDEAGTSGLGASQHIHRTIRDAVIRGELAPGTRLGEDDVARRFAVSRTPVREAFLRLEAERLVQRVGRGLVVASVTPEEILEIYAVRQVVDGLAARLAAEAARPQDIEQLRWLNGRVREAATAQDADAMSALNLDWHEAVCAAGRNSFLLELMEMVHDRVRRFPGTTFSVGSRPAKAIAEHEAIIDAIERRDAGEAERLARLHMQHAMAVRIQLLRDAAE